MIDRTAPSGWSSLPAHVSPDTLRLLGELSGALRDLLGGPLLPGYLEGWLLARGLESGMDACGGVEEFAAHVRAALEARR
jgi:hypothetical protein